MRPSAGARLVFILAIFIASGVDSRAETVTSVAGGSLKKLSYASLEGFQESDFLGSWRAFLLNCESILAKSPEQRPARSPLGDIKFACERAVERLIDDSASARQFFERWFEPHEIVPDNSRFVDKPAFFTGYYEPVVDGALDRGDIFTEPLLAPPDDLVELKPGEPWPESLKRYSAARRRPDGTLEAYPDRKAIELGDIAVPARPVAWVRDAIEAFMIQVQGSAAIRLENGELLRVSYAGRNGQPYTSIGKVLVDDGLVPLEEMNLVRLKQWVRDHGQSPGEPGRDLLHRNASFVFFSADFSNSRVVGPIGGSGVPLSSLNSIAIDRTIWSYGLPFWIDATIPWMEPGRDASPLRRLFIAQDTGGAILGPARADIYFGSGDRAGVLAGGIRHSGRMIVLLPRQETLDHQK